MKATQQRHAQRIQRVIDYIHAHFAEELDSAAVAEVAHLSEYHWHRIYVAVTGESAVSTLRRVRLQKTAAALLRDDRPVAQIASECGFDNLQAFTRLFSRTYGLPPGKFRSSRSISVQAQQETAISNANCADSNERISQSQDAGRGKATIDKQVVNGRVEIAERAPLRIVGLWHSGNYNEIGRVFEKVMAAAEIESWPRSEPFTIGIYFDDPDVVPVDSCRSFAGIPVPGDFQVPAGYEEQEVQGGLHAACLHTGPHVLLEDSYRWLYREWVRESDHDARDIPCHEVYLNNPYEVLPSALQTLICMPLEAKSI